MPELSSLAIIQDTKAAREKSEKAKNNERKIKLMKNRSLAIFTVLSGLICFGLLPQMRAGSEAVPYLPESFSGTNTFDGFHALAHQTANTYNSAFGWESLATQTTATAVTGCGAGTLLFNTADNNTAVGAAALLFNTSGTQNIAVGGFAMFQNVTGSQNTAAGFGAMQNAVGGLVVFNTAVGIQALMNTTANANVAVGDFALQNDTSGHFNTAIGAHAGSNQTTGSQNVYIGQGIEGVAGESNHTYIQNINTTSVSGGGTDFVTVDLTTGLLGHLSSSRRYKEEIKPMDSASETLYRLKPVTYRYKKEIDATQSLDYGLVAEDVADVDPNLAIRDGKGQIESVRYMAINAMLLNEFLKEHKKVEAQQASITELKSTVAQQQKGMEVLTAQLKEQAAQIQKVSAQLEANNPAPQVVVNKP